MTAYMRYGKRWTIVELLSLQREYELLELPIKEIAIKHYRSQAGILSKLVHEGFIESWEKAKGFDILEYRRMNGVVETDTDTDTETYVAEYGNEDETEDETEDEYGNEDETEDETEDEIVENYFCDDDLEHEILTINSERMLNIENRLNVLEMNIYKISKTFGDNGITSKQPTKTY